jgi:hypothetical protein
MSDRDPFLVTEPIPADDHAGILRKAARILPLQAVIVEAMIAGADALDQVADLRKAAAALHAAADRVVVGSNATLQAALDRVAALLEPNTGTGKAAGTAICQCGHPERAHLPTAPRFCRVCGFTTQGALTGMCMGWRTGPSEGGGP